jgi:hypothetical protein
VPDYRLYRLDPFSGHIDGVEDMSASDDIEAICLVQNLQRTVPVELWRGGVKVVRIDAPPEIVPPAPNLAVAPRVAPPRPDARARALHKPRPRSAASRQRLRPNPSLPDPVSA